MTLELDKLLFEMQRDGLLKGGSEEDEAMRAVLLEKRRLCAEMNNMYILMRKSELICQVLQGRKSMRVSPCSCRFQNQGSITIGDGSLIGHNVVLTTIKYDYNSKNRGTMYLKPIVLEENSWIGANATILSGITIGENSIVAAGSAITKDVPANTIVAGSPAKFMLNLEDKI